MSFFLNSKGEAQHVEVKPTVYLEAKAANKSVAHHINSLYAEADVDPKYGTAFDQICASEGLALARDNPFGTKSPMLSDILEGKASFSAAVGNTANRTDPYGNQSRTLFPAAVIQLIEDSIQPERDTDDAIFRKMVASTVSIDTDTFTQPVISYQNAGGANNGAQGARAQRISQLGGTPMLLALTTGDQYRKIPTYGMGIEMSEQAMRATTLDLLVMTVDRYIQIEKDQRVYGYLSDIFNGDQDLNTGAVTAVTTIALDPTSPAGVVTHKAWLKFLARNRKKRKITYVIADLDTYMKVEGRTGRPGSNNYDPTLARIDPQAEVINNTFGGNVKWFIVDSAAEGGPVPANTIWALDDRQGIMLVKNTTADYKATEEFVLRRSSVMIWHWSEAAYRMYSGDLTPFDVLTIS